jgi:hypothetical protein
VTLRRDRYGDLLPSETDPVDPQTGERVTPTNPLPRPGASARGWAAACYSIALILAVMGFLIMVAGPRHVGADAYNYVLNAVYGLGWFALALCFVVAGAANGIIGELRDRPR